MVYNKSPLVESSGWTGYLQTNAFPYSRIKFQFKAGRKVVRKRSEKAVLVSLRPPGLCKSHFQIETYWIKISQMNFGLSNLSNLEQE